MAPIPFAGAPHLIDCPRWYEYIVTKVNYHVRFVTT